MMARPAVDRGIHLRVEEASQVNLQDPAVRATLVRTAGALTAHAIVYLAEPCTAPRREEGVAKDGRGCDRCAWLSQSQLRRREHACADGKYPRPDGTCMLNGSRDGAGLARYSELIYRDF